MKKIHLPLLLAALSHANPSNAQLHVGPGSTLYVSAGATLQVDSLILIPTAALAISNNKIEKTNAAQTTPGGTSINQVYLIDTPLHFQGTAGIYYSTSGLHGNTATSLTIVVADTLTNTFQNTTGSTVNISNQFVSTGFNSVVRLGKISAGSSAAPLQLNIISFDAWQEGPRVRLTWATVADISIAAYTIERSVDGIQFSPLLLLNAKGNTAGNTEYVTYDAAPLSPDNYYRLASRDKQGRLSYHGIRKVRFGNNNPGLQLSAWPVPATDFLHIDFSAQPDRDAVLLLCDVAGKVVLRIPCTQQRTTLSLHDIAAGIYLLHYNAADGIQTLRIEKR